MDSNVFQLLSHILEGLDRTVEHSGVEPFCIISHLSSLSEYSGATASRLVQGRIIRSDVIMTDVQKNAWSMLGDLTLGYPGIDLVRNLGPQGYFFASAKESIDGGNLYVVVGGSDELTVKAFYAQIIQKLIYAGIMVVR